MIKHQVIAYTNEEIEVNGEMQKIGYTFEKFTNSGKLSKSDDHFYLIETYPELKEAAESEIAKFITLVKQTESDMKRALELKAIIDNADFDSELVSIKHKVSKSKWYDNDGVGNMRSRYDVKVPVAVKDEALELQAIRKKHQGNDTFDFSATSYKTITEREADHDNF
ncbi:hypothetical protein P7H00_14380 [Enterococcus pseudoavium]|uniref:Uncharacterized protein n=1 Tax=Enterococcus pseudoavium TaxID=44007 RepID=A0AAE4L4U0_9ENTE|nr:hypothetical protein [Enterococcus pseudoavium]MDT2738289.1 hypothetical protein [Enterococcus pseudoavium]